MHIKVILNRITNYKSFVFEKMTWIDSGDGKPLSLEVEIRPRSNGLMTCSGCGKVCPDYDRHADPRRFEFVPLWGIMVYFVYRIRPVHTACFVRRCDRCGADLVE